VSPADAPLIAGYAPLPESGADCGCCEGTRVETPQSIENRPNLAAVVYRVGSHRDFKASMLARLSSEALPSLAGLKTRDDDDFSIALIDAWAVVCDVLTFYQERIANEAFLGTATERRSLIELGHLVGYRLAPGVAAATDLAFTLESPPGAPADAVAETRIPAGTRVQSIPGPDETAQTFETVEEIVARVAWNALKPRQTQRILPAKDHIGTYLKGVATGLRPGDAILIVGHDRAVSDPGSELWDFRRLIRVETDPEADRTYVEWTPGLGSIHPPGQPAQKEQAFYALRLRASLFGYNAPHPKVLAADTRGQYDNIPTSSSGKVGDWSFDIDTAGKRIHLDAVYQTITEGSWVVLTCPPAFAELYKVEHVTDSGQAKYAVSGRATRLDLDTEEGLTAFEDSYRETSAYAQSERLDFAETPVLLPVWGDKIVLDTLAEELEDGRRLVVHGKRARVRVETSELTVETATVPAVSKTFELGAELVLLAPPQPVAPGSASKVWALRAPGGFEGFATAPDSSFTYVHAAKDDETIAEAATLDSTAKEDDTHTRVRLTEPLEAAFDRASTVILANVAPATHGETVSEILGAGDAVRPFQSFVLKQAPLTHVSAATESGTTSTLAVRVDDLLWREVPALYGRGPRERVYTTRLTDEGQTVVQFGDGREGARPPTGRDNIVAEYRKGIGRDGSVGAGKISLLLDRPLGLREAVNPVPATGGADPETLAEARRNTPITTLTLGRVVSLRDYQNFAMGFAGIAKAAAGWTWDGDTRRILVTVAGPDGEPVPSDGDTYVNLLDALRRYGDPLVPVDLKTYRPATFKLKLKVKVKVDPDHLEDRVLADVEAALRAAYGFDAAQFGQLISQSAVIAVAQGVDGVVAIDLDRLYRTTPPSAAPIAHARLLAQPATLDPVGTLLAAEILTLDPAPFDGLEPLT
jgi:hypothetical protein